MAQAVRRGHLPHAALDAVATRVTALILASRHVLPRPVAIAEPSKAGAFRHGATVPSAVPTVDVISHATSRADAGAAVSGDAATEPSPVPGGSPYVRVPSPALEGSPPAGGKPARHDVPALPSPVLDSPAPALSAPFDPAARDGGGSAAIAPTAAQSLLDTNHQVARRAALSCAVLLKNSPAVLPLRRELGRLCVIGQFAVEPRYQGAGSSNINAHTIDEPIHALREAFSRHAAISADEAAQRVTYSAGYDAAKCVDDSVDVAAIDAAVSAAEAAEAAVLLIGLPTAFEAEGLDREHMRMPTQMVRLMAAVGNVNPATVVVLMGGAPVEVSSDT